MSIQAATFELEQARSLSRARKRPIERSRSEVLELDAAVEAVERHNLESSDGIPAQVRALVLQLARRLSVSAPPSVMRARTLARRSVSPMSNPNPPRDVAGRVQTFQNSATF